MAGVISLLDQPRTLGANGLPTTATVYFYYTETTTLAPIYQDVDLTIPRTNPIDLASGAIFPDVFLDPSVTYRRRIVYGDGTIHDVDPLPNTGSGSISQLSVVANPTSANYVLGSPGVGALLLNNPYGAHNGDGNTGLGFGVFLAATSVYASTAVGAGAGIALTTGHSNTLYGYQAGNALTTGIMNTLIGVDAGLYSVTTNYTTVVGHHCLNLGVFAGQGAVVIGQQTARNLTTGDYIIAIGRNAMANSPATGSSNAVVIGGVAAIAAAVSNSIVLGMEAISVGVSVTESVIAGYRNHYGGAPINSVSVGNFGFFRGTGGGGTLNAGLGHQHGFQIAGDNNVFVGANAAYRAANTTVNGAVCIGNSAGYNVVTTGDLYIGNSDPIGSHLIWGNFNSKTLKLRADHLTLVDDGDYANDAAAAAGGIALQEVYFNTTSNAYTKRLV